MSYLLLQRIVGQSSRKECWFTYCKMAPDEVGHTGTFDILHLTYYVLGHTKSFPGILTSMVVWALGRRARSHCEIHPTAADLQPAEKGI